MPMPPRTHLLRCTRADGSIYAVGPMSMRGCEFQARHWKHGETVEIIPKPVLSDSPPATLAEREKAAHSTCPHCHRAGLDMWGLLYGEELAKWKRYESAAFRNVMKCRWCGWNEVSGAPREEVDRDRKGTAWGT